MPSNIGPSAIGYEINSADDFSAMDGEYYKCFLCLIDLLLIFYFFNLVGRLVMFSMSWVLEYSNKIIIIQKLSLLRLVFDQIALKLIFFRARDRL